MRKAALLFLCCVLLCAGWVERHRIYPQLARLWRPARIKVGSIGPLPTNFPRPLLGFEGPIKAFGLDGKAWDAHGIGGPSTVLYVRGNYWVCASGYATNATLTEAIGCWFGPDLASLQPYAGNPVLVNNHPVWAESCIEGPDLNTDGKNIYLSYVGFRKLACDAEGYGSIGISATSIDTFPVGFTPVPQVPQIPQPRQLQWLFRPYILEIDGICYDYSNGGAYVQQPVIASFKTNGPCASTEMQPGAWTFNRFEVAISQPWEGFQEVEEPQVLPLKDGSYVMLYGGAWSFKAGYAITRDPVHGSWMKLDTNPIRQEGVLWLPRIVADQSGQYWMFGNFNNTPQMNLWKANGH